MLCGTAILFVVDDEASMREALGVLVCCEG